MVTLWSEASASFTSSVSGNVRLPLSLISSSNLPCLAVTSLTLAVEMVLIVPEKNMHRATTAASVTSPLMAIFFIAFVFLYLSSVSWTPSRMSFWKYR